MSEPKPQLDIICDCCDSGSVDLVNNSEIYGGRSYGDWPYAYLCRDCGAYVGIHPGTNKPLGTLADKPTRAARTQCKEPFEKIWKRGYMGRGQAYEWLANRLGIEKDGCHFGSFDVEMCHRAYDLCMDYLRGTTQ